MNSKQLQLKPEQAAVVAAFQRLCSAMEMEAQQLSSIYHQPGAAATLRNHIVAISKEGDSYIADCERAIVIAHEMPRQGTVLPP